MEALSSNWSIDTWSWPVNVKISILSDSHREIYIYLYILFSLLYLNETLEKHVL